VAGGNRGLERVGPQLLSLVLGTRLGTLQRRKAAADEQLVPARSVLVEQQDRLARGAGPRVEARSLDLHQCNEAMDLRLIGRQPGQDAAEPQRVLAQLRPHPVIAGGGGVALVEDEIDDLEHGGEALDELGPARHFVGNALLGQRAFGPHDTLGHRGLRHQKGACDFLGREPTDQPQRQRHAGLRGQYRVAGGEDKAQQIVGDVVVEGSIKVGLGCLGLGL
jgi:uncharacterized protein (DUF2384 family)